MEDNNNNACRGYALLTKLFFTFMWTKLLCCTPTVDLCPSVCSCSISEQDEIHVDCSEQNITAIPRELPPNTAGITLNYNIFPSIDLLNFPSLPNLKKVSLQYSNVKHVGSFDDEITHDLGTQYSNVPRLEVFDLMHNELLKIPKYLPQSLRVLHLGSNYIDFIDGDCLLHLTDLRELFLDNNAISWLDWSSFHNSTLSLHDAKGQAQQADVGVVMVRLEKLALNSNRINSISQSAFKGMHSLTALTLSRNKLTVLNVKTFKDLKRLQHLDLSYNKLTEIPQQTFEGVQFLKYLNLNHNRISHVPASLPMLEWLDLSYNRITNVSEDLKPVIFPAEVFNFANNPLHCDCKIRWLKELYDRREYLIKHIDVAAEDFVPSCVSPRRLAGETWDHLADKLFTCEEDPGDATVYEDPLDVRPKSQMDRLKIKSGAIKDTSIQVFWTHPVPATYSNVFIQSYAFGLRSTTVKYVELSAAQQEFSVRHLRPQTNYVVCVIPKLKDSDLENLQPYSLDHCLEVQTKSLEDVVEEVSFMSVVFWYILGMLGTIISIFSCVGGVALVYGLYSSKTDWSAKYAQDIQLDAPIDDINAESAPPTQDGDTPNPGDIPRAHQAKDKTD